MCFSFRCSNLQFHRDYFTSANYAEVQYELEEHNNSRCLRAIGDSFHNLYTSENDPKTKIEYVDRLRKVCLLKKVPKNLTNTYVSFITKGTMLHASHFGYTELTKDLHEKGISYYVQGKNGKLTPLHYAAQEGHVELIKQILVNISGLEARETLYGRTALHMACENKHFKIVACLIERKANINQFDRKGFTPLHLALASFESQDPKTAGRLGLYLFSKGANPQLHNNDKVRPIRMIQPENLSNAFTTFNVSNYEPLSKDVWIVVLRHLENDFLLEKVRRVCKFLNNLAIHVVVRDFIAKSN